MSFDVGNKIILSFDVEHWHLGFKLRGITSWQEDSWRDKNNIEIILSILEKNNCRSTFFVTGKYAESYPEVVRRINEKGHEIACHGYNHDLIYNLSPEAFFQMTETPIGLGTVNDYLRIRIFDAWTHLQDIRRAVGVPGDLEGPVAEHSIDRVAMAMPYVVARKAEIPSGSVVVFEITGSEGRKVGVAVNGNRGVLLDTIPEAPTVAASHQNLSLCVTQAPDRLEKRAASSAAIRH